MTSWHTKEWQDKRKKRIKDQVCQQCGKKLELQIHHTYTQQNLYRIMERRVVRQLIREKMDKGEIPFQGIEERWFVCQSCANRQKIPNPRYKNVTCKKCQQKQALNSQNMEIIKIPNYNLGRTGLRIFLQKHRTEIDSRLKAKKAPSKPDYMNLEVDTVVLCKTCHYALENGYDMCPKCKSNYKKIQEIYCSKCNSKSN